MKKINIILILLTILILPIASAHEPVDPGVTPDSFLWGLDKALDNLNLLLTFKPADKARKGIEIARERLEEIKVMAEQNKLEAAEKGKEAQLKVLSKVKQSISDIKEESSTQQIEEEVELETELEEHEEEIEEASDSLKIKLEVKGILNEQQKALLGSILSSLENKTGEIKIEIKNKKEKTKIKIKQETGKSEKDIEEEIGDIEEEKGLAELKKEKAAEEIEDAKEDLAELEKELQEHKAEGHVADETPITTLMDNAKKRISNAEEAFKNKDFGEAFGQANAAEQLIGNAERILEKTVERFEEEHKEEREIEVKIEDGKTKVKIEINDEKLRFTLETTDRNEIIQEIAEKTGLSIDEVTKLAEFEEEMIEENEQLCEAGGGVWREFPNEGQFCHDECSKPEKVICKRFMSMGCDCGESKCWNGKACVTDEKEERLKDDVIKFLCTPSKGSDLGHEVRISANGDYYQLIYVSTITLVEPSGKIEKEKRPAIDMPTMYYNKHGKLVSSCGGLIGDSNASFCTEILPTLTFKSENLCEKLEIKGKETKLCKVGGCSGQLCGEASFIDNVVTTCEWKEEYDCYQKHGKCEIQANGQCGWTQTKDLLECIEKKKE